MSKTWLKKEGSTYRDPNEIATSQSTRPGLRLDRGGIIESSIFDLRKNLTISFAANDKQKAKSDQLRLRGSLGIPPLRMK